MHWLTGSLLEKFSTGKSSALDIGCGTKKWDRWFRCPYIGIDIYKESKADVLSTGFNIPFKNNSFDFVTMFSVLEYIENDNEVLNEIYRVIKPKGKLLLISQNKRATNANIRQDPKKALLHKHTYTLSGILKQLKNNNFRPISYRYPILFGLGLYYHLTSVYFFTISEVKK